MRNIGNRRNMGNKGNTTSLQYLLQLITTNYNKLLPITIILFAIITSCTRENNKPGETLIQLSYEEDITPNYYEIIEMYEKLAKHYPQAKLLEYGKTDAGKPLHLFVISKQK